MVPEHSHHYDEYGGARDEYVGNVEYREMRQAHEVDNMATQWTRGSENPIGQIAADPGNEHAAGNKRPTMTSARHPHTHTAISMAIAKRLINTVAVEPIEKAAPGLRIRRRVRKPPNQLGGS